MYHFINRWYRERLCSNYFAREALLLHIICSAPHQPQYLSSTTMFPHNTIRAEHGKIYRHECNEMIIEEIKHIDFRVEIVIALRSTLLRRRILLTLKFDP